MNSEDKKQLKWRGKKYKVKSVNCFEHKVMKKMQLHKYDKESCEKKIVIIMAHFQIYFRDKALCEHSKHHTSYLVYFKNLV